MQIFLQIFTLVELNLIFFDFFEIYCPFSKLMNDFEKITKIEKRRKDKSQIATIDKVLDPKTLEILKRLKERSKLFDLSGCFSSGKEANIYTARCSNSLISKFIQQEESFTAPEIVPVVLKIYKTSTMMFKDRTRYIIDEQRFKSFCTSNSRKLIKIWSEKEVRNLKRIGKQGILCPTPLYLKRSILIMSMIGDETPAPKLKDVSLSPDQWEIVYEKCIKLIKDMYQKAHLIHADFSEYNLIYHNNEVYVIDVSQSMDINQENSNSFLVMDLCNCNDFFIKKIKSIKSEVDLFEDITGLRIPEYLKVDGKLNKECFIPSRIIEIANKEDISLFIDDFKNTGLSDNFLASLGNLNFDNVERDMGVKEIEYSSDIEEIDSEEDGEDDSLDQEEYYDANDQEDEMIDQEEFITENNDSHNVNLDHDNSDISSSCDVDQNEICSIQDDFTLIVKNDKTAIFQLKTYAELTENKIDIYVRRLRLKYPEMTKDEEKKINKERKAIVKQMNKDRRIKRVQRKEDYKKKDMKKAMKKKNKI